MDKYSRTIALLSFLIGTLFMLHYYVIADFETFFYGGGIFFLIATVINFINVIVLIVLLILKKKRSNGKSLLLILANIPIAALYFFLTTHFMSGMKIDFINGTGSEISNVKITGCKEINIGTLEKNEKVSYWINSNCEEPNNIHYIINGDTITEYVSTYIDLTEVKRMAHLIGEKNGRHKKVY